MARIAGIDLPKNKRGCIGLTYIYGIGRSMALEILEAAEVDPDTKVDDWTDDEQARIRQYINEQVKTEGALRSEVQLSIKRLMDIGSPTGACATVPACPCAASAPAPTAAPARASARRWPTRRKRPSRGEACLALLGR
jgi:small subunit ribosomal protein S13